MLDNSKITNTDELEFAVFCIENIAIRLGKNAEEVYQALTEKSDILSNGRKGYPIMILYHGSYPEIQTPDLLHSRENVDFGRGFYTTPIYEQAVK